MNKLARLFAIAALLVPQAALAASAPVIIVGPNGGAAAVNNGALSVGASLVQGGNTAAVSADGNLSVNTPPASQFFDAFSSTLDTTTNWTANNSTGTAATSAGSLVVSSSTTASAWGGLSSKQSWTPQGISLEIFGVWASFSATTLANSVRLFGVFTVPGSPTTAAPVTDGYVWRLDGTGALFAEIWASGVAVSSTNVTTICPISNGVPNTYAINFRTGLTQFYCGSTLAATVGFSAPVNQTLPVSAFSIAGSTPPLSSAAMTLNGITLATYAPPEGSKAAGQAPTINDPYGLVGVSPNANVVTASIPPGTPITASTTGTTGAVTSTLAAAAAKTTYICGFTISSDATAAIAGTATVTGGISGTLSFIQNVGTATTASVLTQSFNPCIPGSATNTAIAVNSVAAGTGGNTAVVAWGFQK